jgi:tetratricopeptide (TPR) repeat protein
VHSTQGEHILSHSQGSPKERLRETAVRMWVAWLLPAAGLVVGSPNACAAAGSPQISSIEQHSEGACSPPIINNHGQVSISCSGVAPEALRYLESNLTVQFNHLSEQLTHLEDSARTIRNLNDLNDSLRKQANDWAQRYRELSARLAESRDDSEQAKQARELIQQGEFAKAEAILQALATKEENDVARAAATQYDLGDLAMLRFDPPGALPHYEKAFRYKPDDLTYTITYAVVATGERHYVDAEKAINQALDAMKLSGNRGSTDHRSAIAYTLLMLGEVYINMSRPAAAEKVTSQAMEICRELASSDPASDTYRQLLASAQLDFGLLYLGTGRLKESETALSEALTLERDLATGSRPQAKLLLVAILNDLSLIYITTNENTKAENAANEALQISSDLSSINQNLSRSLVSSTEINLGTIYIRMHRFEEAEKTYKDALEIRKNLALHAPGGFRPDVAKILVDLSNVYDQTNRPADAEKALNDALEIYRDEVLRNPDSFGFAFVDASIRIASLRKKNGQLKEAEEALIEAKNIVEPLADSNPSIYSGALAAVAEKLSEIRK